MWDDAAKKLAIKAIATVESNLRYDAINYNDAITVGIMQWYGTRAASLLMQIRPTAAWVGVEASITASLDANPATDATYWTNRDLNRSEGVSLKPVLTSAIGVQTQNAQALADFETYKVTADRYGVDADTNTNAFIFFCVLYHQSPKYSRQVVNVAGEQPTLERLYTLAMNHPWLGDFKTRLNTARSIILSGDSSGIPDFGVDESPEYDGGDAGELENPPQASGQSLGDIRHVLARGDALHIILKDGTTVICNPTGSGSWLPGMDAQPGTGPVIAPTTPETSPTTPPEPSPTTPDGSTATEDALEAFLLARVDRYMYSQGAGRLTPDTSGVTDCSALVRYAYRKVAGVEIGLTTVDQQNYGKVVWRNTPGNSFGASKGAIPSLSLLRKGDLVYFSWDNSYTRVRHVEMYLGDGRLIGHGIPRTYGPIIKESAVGYMDDANWIIVRRHL